MTPPQPKRAFILIADEPDLRAIVKDSITPVFPNAVIVEANSGLEALRKAALQPFHLIITDIGEPGKDALKVIDAFEKMKENKPSAILILSSKITLEYETVFKKKGVDYIKKPCTGDILSKKIKSLIDMILHLN